MSCRLDDLKVNIELGLTMHRGPVKYSDNESNEIWRHVGGLTREDEARL